MFTKMYILEFGNTDFYRPVVNLGHLSRLNSVEFMLPVPPSFLFLMPEAPQARITLLPLLQTGTFEFGLHAKMAQSSAIWAGGKREGENVTFYTRLVVT